MMRAARLPAMALSLGLSIGTLIPSAHAQTGDVVLQLKESAVEFVGRLRAYDGASYTIETRAFGVLSLEAARYTCLDGPCPGQPAAALANPGAVPTGEAGTMSIDPARTAEAATVAIHGSAIAGETLLPALIRAQAASRGGTVKQLVGTDAAALRFRVADVVGLQPKRCREAKQWLEAGVPGQGCHGAIDQLVVAIGQVQSLRSRHKLD